MINCPKCQSKTKVIQTIEMEKKNLRRRKCENPECNHTFMTKEIYSDHTPKKYRRVVQQNQETQNLIKEILAKLQK